MLDPTILLDVRFEISSVFSTYKMELGESNSRLVTATITDTDAIYVGYYKPFKYIYTDVTTVNTNAGTLTVEFYNGTDWEEPANSFDETEMFTKSGFIQLVEDDLTDWEASTVNTQELYWLKLTPSVSTSATIFNFMGLMFSDDKVLETENPYINDTEMLLGETNHLKANLAARNQIIKKFQNQPYYKINSSGERVRLTSWDLLDIHEVRQASIYLTLSKIYFNLSDSSDDAWMAKSKEYKDFYEDAIKMALISLDTNDNGITDPSENLVTTTNSRLWR